MPPLDTERDPRAYDEEEDYSMPHRYAEAANDREISLGTGTILACFFALALVCSVFFGMGYAVGHKSTPPPTVAAAAPTHTLADTFKSFKPAASVPTESKPTTPAPEETPKNAIVVPTTPAKPAPGPVATKKPFDPDAEIVTSVDPKPTAPAATPTGSAIVQIAAVSHQEDADSLLASLKRKGYTVAIHREPQDKYLHLQMGPYASKKDAEAMRAKLLADGFNSILK